MAAYMEKIVRDSCLSGRTFWVGNVWRKEPYNWTYGNRSNAAQRRGFIEGEGNIKEVGSSITPVWIVPRGGWIPPPTPMIPAVIIISSCMFLFPEVNILDENKGIVIVKVAQSLGQLTLNDAGNGHLSALAVDRGIEKPLV